MDAPVFLTVYTSNGEVTVSDVREESIELENGDLICEEQNNTYKCRIFRFYNVIGYSTVPGSTAF